VGDLCSSLASSISPAPTSIHGSKFPVGDFINALVFSVDKGRCSYMALWNAFKRIAASCSAAENAALFAGTASKFYRLV
jgi:predicted TIM-barrel fold metal-dependent hydrolase